MVKRFYTILVVLVLLVCVGSVAFAENDNTGDENFWKAYDGYFEDRYDEEYPDYTTATIMDDPEYYMYYEDDVDPVDVRLTEEPIANESYLVKKDWHGHEATVKPVFGSIELPCAMEQLFEYFGVKDQIWNFYPERTAKYSWIPLFHVSFRCGSFLMANSEQDVSSAMNSQNYILRVKDGIVALLDTFMYSDNDGDFVDFVLKKLGSPKCVLAKSDQIADTGYGYCNYTLCYQYDDMWMLMEIVEDYTGDTGEKSVQWMDELTFTYMNPEDFMGWLDYDQIIY